MPEQAESAADVLDRAQAISQHRKPSLASSFTRACTTREESFSPDALATAAPDGCCGSLDGPSWSLAGILQSLQSLQTKSTATGHRLVSASRMSGAETRRARCANKRHHRGRSVGEACPTTGCVRQLRGIPNSRVKKFEQHASSTQGHSAFCVNNHLRSICIII